MRTLRFYTAVALLGALLSAGCGEDGNGPGAPEPIPEVERLTENDVFDGNPTVSPDGVWILFESDTAGNRDIWRMPAAGGAAEQLTFDPGFDSAPAWDPAGGRIVFESDRDGGKLLFLLELDTPGAQPTALTTGDGEDGSPAWSPDGQWVAFESKRLKGYGADLWTVPAAGGSLQRLTVTADGVYNRSADWSPDSASLVFESSRTGSSALFIQALAGGDAVQLTPDPGYEGHPAWSPDGTLIAFESTASGNSEVYLVAAGGGQALQITFAGGFWPRWTPAGDALVFGVFDEEQPEIWVLRLD